MRRRTPRPAERTIQEINSGIYAFALDHLFDALKAVAAENTQHEYYLPDLVGIYRARGLGVETVVVPDSREIRGVNSRLELAEMSSIVRQAKNIELMAAGVSIDDPATTYVDRDVAVGQDTVIHPGVSLEGRTTIGSGCEIHSGVRIVNSRIGDRVVVHNHTIIASSSIGDDASIGPFAHLRQDTSVGTRAKVGNFVEMKNAALGDGSKSMHLTYLGDADDRRARQHRRRHHHVQLRRRRPNTQTTIEDGAFIGSDSQLIAPVTVGNGAYVGSRHNGPQNVPAGALAVSPAKQRNIEGWVEKRRKKRH